MSEKRFHTLPNGQEALITDFQFAVAPLKWINEHFESLGLPQASSDAEVFAALDQLGITEKESESLILSALMALSNKKETRDFSLRVLGFPEASDDEIKELLGFTDETPSEGILNLLASKARTKVASLRAEAKQLLKGHEGEIVKLSHIHPFPEGAAPYNYKIRKEGGCALSSEWEADSHYVEYVGSENLGRFVAHLSQLRQMAEVMRSQQA